ncbi:hypothetical protein [Spirosoma endophyticum]|uniref:Uncharacterized protein n=1 Tax=Spirosoma endophyticum TaxID=662367 RepID=A0A1I2EQD0_9BACT|nr:hypothetical protein [Spirosoma endophyticum]SFE95314.1 hypothetical protein SAMN05216167_12312 [Spirosoma endophyticum]
MAILYVSGRDQEREFQQYAIDDEAIEYYFDVLNHLVKAGFQVSAVKLVIEGKAMLLPVEAFDGELVEEHLRALQQIWEELLLLK